MLGPLLGAALENVLRLGISGLTGPVVRGDAGVGKTALVNYVVDASDMRVQRTSSVSSVATCSESVSTSRNG